MSLDHIIPKTLQGLNSKLNMIPLEVEANKLKKNYFLYNEK